MSGILTFIKAIPWLWVLVGAALGMFVLPRFGL